MPKRQLRFLLFSIGCLLAGAANYIFFQQPVHFVQLIGIHTVHRDISPHFLSVFVTGYLSDILWCCSLCALTVVLNERKYLTLWGKIFILTLPFATEIAQGLRIFPGTFDWTDLLVYFLIEYIFLTFLFKKLPDENN